MKTALKESKIINLEGYKMLVENPYYTQKVFDFAGDQEGDYLKAVSGSIDNEKNFTYLRFDTAMGNTFEAGEIFKFNGKPKLKKVKMDKDDRPICFKVSLRHVYGLAHAHYKGI